MVVEIGFCDGDQRCGQCDAINDGSNNDNGVRRQCEMMAFDGNVGRVVGRAAELCWF